jgi:hypothetical protein
MKDVAEGRLFEEMSDSLAVAHITLNEVHVQ